ncbi:MAG: N-acetyltransferase family protein [Candidatus Firestonebacteria bacterium]
MLIRKALKKDAPAITEIYNYYIKNTPVTFEVKPLKPAELAKRMDTPYGKYPWIVGVVEGKVIGYAYASEFQERAAYRYTKELTVYLDKDWTGRGYGKAL